MLAVQAFVAGEPLAATCVDEAGASAYAAWLCEATDLGACASDLADAVPRAGSYVAGEFGSGSGGAVDTRHSSLEQRGDLVTTAQSPSKRSKVRSTLPQVQSPKTPARGRYGGDTWTSSASS